MIAAFLFQFFLSIIFVIPRNEESSQETRQRLMICIAEFIVKILPTSG